MSFASELKSAQTPTMISETAPLIHKLILAHRGMGDG